LFISGPLDNTVGISAIGDRHVTKEDVFVELRHVGSIRGVAAHEDGYIATAGDDGRVILWEKATGKSVSGSSHSDVVNDCAFSRDGRYLVSSSDDWTARLWSVPDLSLKAVLAGHGDDVTISAFHPVEELIATVSRDYFVRVYDFNANLVAKFGADGVVGDVAWLEWTEDGRELVSLSNGGQLARWPCANTQPTDTSGDEHSPPCPGRTDSSAGPGQRPRASRCRRKPASGTCGSVRRTGGDRPACDALY
jgi:WD40 repeat protein